MTQTITRPAIRYVTATVRILLGALFAFSGITKFLPVAQGSTEGMPERAIAFSTALGETGYMMPMTAAVEVVVGILLLVNRFVPLALALLAPVVVNIVAFHTFLMPDGIVMVYAIAALEIYLAWAYRAAFRPMLRAKPHAAEVAPPVMTPSTIA